jgi:hypothetical protein
MTKGIAKGESLLLNKAAGTSLWRVARVSLRAVRESKRGGTGWGTAIFTATTLEAVFRNADLL